MILILLAMLTAVSCILWSQGELCHECVNAVCFTTVRELKHSPANCAQSEAAGTPENMWD